MLNTARVHTATNCKHTLKSTSEALTDVGGRLVYKC